MYIDLDEPLNGDFMTTISAYFDGTTVRTLEPTSLKKNQRLVITVLDEFISDEAKVKTLRGCLSKYANKDLQPLEKNAWADSVKEKYGTR